MDLGKLAKKLKNELLRNPKKSAILGIICLVALYFWFPLIRGWLPGGTAKKPAKGADSTPVAASQAPAPAAAPSATSAESKSAARSELAYRWDKLVKQRQLDPLTSPRKLGERVRNPFLLSDEMKQTLAALEEERPADDSPPAAEKPPIEVTPQILGLVLKGTVVGARLRAAQINARTYQEGETVAVGEKSKTEGAPAGEANRVAFTLAAVHRDHVVLTREDKSYTLAFPRRGLADEDHIVQLKSPENEP